MREDLRYACNAVYMMYGAAVLVVVVVIANIHINYPLRNVISYKCSAHPYACRR